MSITAMNRKPALLSRRIRNACFGFLGIQFVFASQNANVSWSFQMLGTGVDAIPARGV